ncbi:FAR [Lepeophtheirus salmonis]|uniref:Fatty acyl-CoA reductase n=1 Tax=Lepeophtheirus salmonis TaxID=72036 RepID=A0A7R8CG55_LEPSM|nr:FAR [Lepeophtheirus salmonis]CAF2812719.1 FAR [Lepeophtheirus salmonis]
MHRIGATAPSSSFLYEKKIRSTFLIKRGTRIESTAGRGVYNIPSFKLPSTDIVNLHSQEDSKLLGRSRMGEVAGYYEDKSIFITGATGFMGKVLLCKLLRCCSDLSRIYVLIRPKRGLDPHQRLAKLMDAHIFKDLSEQNKSKVVLVEGDVTQPRLGLCQEDIDTILLNVNVFFHSAATVKFDEDLTLSVQMNVAGTLSALELASKIKDLKAFVHVSTAYCNPHVNHLEEKVYHKDMPYSPREIIDLVREKGDVLNEKNITKELMNGWPNSYTFTKAIAEKAILQYSHILPVAIMRPSIVAASWKDPIPGWIDNLNGPTGVLVGASTGILQSMYIDVDCIADVVPVDICINLLTVIPYYLSKLNNINNNSAISGGETTNSYPLPVFNCTTGTLNPINWKTIESLCHKYAKKYPYQKRFWYITGNGIRVIFGYKPIFRPLICRMTAAFPSLEYFACKSWLFSSTEIERILSELSTEDKAVFGFDVKDVIWEEFFCPTTFWVQDILL